MLCARTGRTYSFLKTAYNEADSHLRPGHVLLGFAMERCCDDPGIDWLDLVSDLPWLHGWRRESMDLQLGFLNTGGWRGRMLIRMLKLRLGPLRRSARRLKAVLARLGVHPGE
jgi:hypothetical protein